MSDIKVDPERIDVALSAAREIEVHARAALLNMDDTVETAAHRVNIWRAMKLSQLIMSALGDDVAQPKELWKAMLLEE